jgi:hypothetical protein
MNRQNLLKKLKEKIECSRIERTGKDYKKQVLSETLKKLDIDEDKLRESINILNKNNKNNKTDK